MKEKRERIEKGRIKHRYKNGYRQRTSANSPLAQTGLNSFRISIIVIIILTIQICSSTTTGIGGDGSGRLRVLFIGAAETPNMPAGPFRSLLIDPFFDVTPVRAFSQASIGYPDDVIAKAVRACMPRTYQELVEKYDMVYFFYANRGPFRTQFAGWISDAVKEEGMGLVFSGHGEWAYDWTVTEIGDLLPVETLSAQCTYVPTWIQIVKEDHPLTSSLPWSSIGQYGVMAGHGFHTVKEGTDLLANLVAPLGERSPFLVCWECGEGRSIAMMTRFTTLENPFLDWEFFPDLCTNLHLHAAQRELPPDIAIVHSIRRALHQYNIWKGMLISTTEFISKMGGNTEPLERVMTQTESKRVEVEQNYLTHDFQTSLQLAEECVQDLEQADGLAASIVNQALLWIYLIEWTTLTSTILVAGAVLWSLMVKRQLYQEVSTTKLTRTSTQPHTTGSRGEGR